MTVLDNLIISLEYRVPGSVPANLPRPPTNRAAHVHQVPRSAHTIGVLSGAFSFFFFFFRKIYKMDLHLYSVLCTGDSEKVLEYINCSGEERDVATRSIAYSLLIFIGS